MPSVHLVVKHTLKFLQHILKAFYRVFDRFQLENTLQG